MGLNIKRNKDGLYQMKSTVSDEIIHDGKWITEKEAKKVLIERAWFDFQEKAIEIYMDFPGGYQVNGKFENRERTGLEFIIKALKDERGTMMDNKFKEICKDLEIDFE